MADLLRVYDEVLADGYPPEWHATIKHLVREQAGHRCVRCGHPYRTGEHGNGEWTPCDQHCRHAGPFRVAFDGGGYDMLNAPGAQEAVDVVAWLGDTGRLHRGRVEAQWRILTVHHLNGNKADCRWWNLAALCQRCHLEIQGRVRMEQLYPFEHSDWFKPYAAGYYASAYLGEDLTREETIARLDELLALERAA